MLLRAEYTCTREQDMALGTYVRELRKARGLTQEVLAEEANLEQTWISQVERGKILEPSPNYMRRLAGGLAVPVRDLYEAAGIIEEHDDTEETSRLAEVRYLSEIGRSVLQVVERQAAAQNEGRHATATRRLPIVNAVAANEAMTHGQQTEDFVTVPAWMLNGSKDPVIFRVVGDCLRDVGIFDTDLLIVDRANREPRQGDIVVARINGEETAKRFYRVAGGIELRPASSGFPTIVANGSDHLEILGVYVTYLPVAKRV